MHDNATTKQQNNMHTTHNRQETTCIRRDPTFPTVRCPDLGTHERCTQMRREEQFRLLCGADDHGTQEQFSHACLAIRSWNHAACVAHLRLYTYLHIVLLQGALCCWWYLAKWQFPFETQTTKWMKTVHSNNSFLMCSTTESTTPKNGSFSRARHSTFWRLTFSWFQWFAH